MIPYYLERNTASVTAIDISPEMAKIAVDKFDAQELSELANHLQGAGIDLAYQQIMDVVTGFDVVNARLDAIWKELTVDTL